MNRLIPDETPRKVFNVTAPSLNRAFVRDAGRYASISEYARASGLDTAEVIELLSSHLDDGTLGLEVYGSEIFVMTAAAGRPIPKHLSDVPPNLWETFRRRVDIDEAFQLWQLTRALEQVGWKVEVVPSRVTSSISQVSEPPLIGLDLRGTVVPVVVRPEPAQMASAVGVLGEYNRAGAPAVAIICGHGELAQMVTATRHWVLEQRAVPPQMTTIILEAPSYNPTILSAKDAAVAPRAVNRHNVENLEF